MHLEILRREKKNRWMLCEQWEQWVRWENNDDNAISFLRWWWWWWRFIVRGFSSILHHKQTYIGRTWKRSVPVFNIIKSVYYITIVIIIVLNIIIIYINISMILYEYAPLKYGTELKTNKYIFVESIVRFLRILIRGVRERCRCLCALAIGIKRSYSKISWLRS